MFKEFLKKLKPVNHEEEREWADCLEEYNDGFGSSEPALFWYLSSGIDLRALVHFNEKDTSEIYKTPTVDFFIYSDYANIEEKLLRYYDELDNGSVVLFRDDARHVYRRPYGRLAYADAERPENVRTLITLEQMIPLQFFSDEESEHINLKYKDSNKSPFKERIISGRAHFYYCLIEIRSSYFGEEYFPVFISPIENWVLMDEIWKKNEIRFDYICGVCDGCRKGGAYKCVNRNYTDFFPVMRENRKLWVSDHLNGADVLGNEFLRVAELRGWGNYSMNRVSYLYEII